jgi:NADPH-dependent ferric siderophore reductase
MGAVFMALQTTLKKLANKVTGRTGPRILSVKTASYLTPNMIRITFAGPELDGFPIGCEGGNCKLMLPNAGESKESFTQRLNSGERPVRRTYTFRHYRDDVQELDIDFVAHGDNGPASSWAMKAKPGSFIGFAGPSGPKVTHFEADWYLVAADPSAIPVAAATLEAMPRDAKGIALFEVTSLKDKQAIDAPSGIEIHWIEHSKPHKNSTEQEAFIRSLEWPDGRVQICVAGESHVIRSLRGFLQNEKQVAKKDLYISGYWKIGLMEDEHQEFKRREG